MSHLSFPYLSLWAVRLFISRTGSILVAAGFMILAVCAWVLCAVVFSEWIMRLILQGNG